MLSPGFIAGNNLYVNYRHPTLPIIQILRYFMSELTYSKEASKMPSKRLASLLGLAFVLIWYGGSAQAQVWIPKKIVGMEYPELAWKARIQGQVEIICMINPDGSVALTIEQGNPHPILTKAARENASKWIFFGKPEPDLLGKATLIYTFTLLEEMCKIPCSHFVFEYPNKVNVTSGQWAVFNIYRSYPKKKKWYWPF